MNRQIGKLRIKSVDEDKEFEYTKLTYTSLEDAVKHLGKTKALEMINYVVDLNQRSEAREVIFRTLRTQGMLRERDKPLKLGKTMRTIKIETRSGEDK